MRSSMRVALSLVVAASLSAAAAGCGGGGGHGGGNAFAGTGGTPTGGTPTGGTPTGGTPTGSTPTGGTTTPGSQYWYQGNTVGNPYKTHDASEAALAAQILSMVNQERANAGVAPLSADSSAERAAKVHAEDMVGRSYFSHTTPEGWGPSERLTMTGATGFNSAGENIAYGQASAAAVMAAWMNSSGHRANILNASYTHLGVGVHEASRHWVQVFLRRP